MSLDVDGYRWCDKCWDNQATHIGWNVDGTRSDMCDEHTDGFQPDTYVVNVEPVRENRIGNRSRCQMTTCKHCESDQVTYLHPSALFQDPLDRLYVWYCKACHRRFLHTASP